MVPVLLQLHTWGHSAALQEARPALPDAAPVAHAASTSTLLSAGRQSCLLQGLHLLHAFVQVLVTLCSVLCKRCLQGDRPALAGAVPAAHIRASGVQEKFKARFKCCLQGRGLPVPDAVPASHISHVLLTFRQSLCAAYREEGLLFQMLSLLDEPQEERQAQAAQQQAGQPC